MEAPRRQQPVFHLFPCLPKELRLQIWELAIPAERLIRVSLKPHGGRRRELAAAEPRYLQKNALGRPISGGRYRAVVEGTKLHSKFLRATSEARHAALAFYRVRVPVCLTGPRRTDMSATLYLNPEHDMLHIEADDPVQETLLDFFWDLRAYDPRGVGLLRLAVDLRSFCCSGLQYLRKSDILLIRQREALVQTLSQLREVWFVDVQSHATTRFRHVYAALSSSSSSQSKPLAERGRGTPADELACNAAVPVLQQDGGSPAFARRGADRREGVEAALARVYMGDVDPRELVFRWRRLLRTWGVVDHGEDAPGRGVVDYRVLLARMPEWDRRQPWRAGGLEKAAAVDEGAAGPGGVTERGEGGGEGAERRGVTGTAFGFWLFPVEALGAIDEGDRLSEMEFYPGRWLDMRNHWPELVLSKCC